MVWTPGSPVTASENVRAAVPRGDVSRAQKTPSGEEAVKMKVKSESKIKMFPDERKLKESATRKPVGQELLLKVKSFGQKENRARWESRRSEQTRNGNYVAE